MALSLNVPVDSTLPINLKVPIDLHVPVNIPLNETQLHDPFNQLRSLLEPYARVLTNLPNSWREMVGQILSGKPNDLLKSNTYSDHPWPGFVTGLGTPIPVPAGPTPEPGSINNPPPEGGPNLGGEGSTVPATSVPVQATPTSIPDLGIITPTRQP